MRFWDSSAVVPLCVDQPARQRSLELHERDPGMVVWWGTRLECASALARLRREGLLGRTDEEAAWEVVDDLERGWHEVVPGLDVRESAERLLRLHPLRAADSLQLAAALQWAGTPPQGEFVTFDHALADAARKEGFTVLESET